MSKLFEEFYGQYPNKKARGNAEKAFDKIMKAEGKDGEVELAKAIMLGLDAQKRYRRASQGKGEFMPNWKHPATWLNGGCWLDEIPSYGELEERHKHDDLANCFCGRQVYGQRFSVCEYHLSFNAQGRMTTPFAPELRAMHQKLKLDHKRVWKH